MRTNVNIADDARELAETFAHANGISLGEAITELIRKGQQAESKEPLEFHFRRSPAGFPLFPPSGRRITEEMIRQAEDEDLV